MKERLQPTMESILKEEEGVSGIDDLEHEDYTLVNSGAATANDLFRLREKYKDRPDLVNVINCYDQTHPLSREHIARARQMIEAIKKGDWSTVQEIIEWKKTLFKKPE
jgi:hypothetical protein